MILQFTLTVPEAKKLIALGALELPEIKAAFKEGKIFLKGGSTVSALAEELVGIKLGICGRITPLGTKGSRTWPVDAPHSILIERGVPRSCDDREEEEILGMRKGDVFVIGANAIDGYGNAAMMAGSALGGQPGKILGGLMGEGINVIILAGLEKLIPGSIMEAVQACGRRKIDLSFGMAVGLIPIVGKLITEQIATELLANVKCQVIGKGGISGAEGATTMVAEGNPDQIEKLFQIIRKVKGTKTSGSPLSLEECRPHGPGCSDDLACIYFKPFKTQGKESKQ